MNPLIITTIAQLGNEHGLAVDLALDFDDLKDLEALADGVTSPPKYADAARMNNFSTFYCLAHATDSESIWEHHNNRRGWEKALKAWRRTLTVDYVTLCREMNAFLLDDERAQIEIVKRLTTPKPDAAPKAAQPKPGQDLGWLLDTLMSEYGGTVKYWIWQAPIDHTRLCLDNHNRRKHRDRREAGDTASDPNDPSIKALRLFRHAEAAFVQKIIDRDGAQAPQPDQLKELAANG